MSFTFTSPRIFLGAAALAASVAGAMGLGFFLFERETFRQEAMSQLRAVSTLQVREIESWRKDLLLEADALRENTFLVSGLREGLESEERRNVVEAWLDSLRARKGFRSVLLLDAAGKVLSAIPERQGQLGSHARALWEEATRKGEVQLSDLYRGDVDPEIHFTLAVPFAGPSRPGAAAGLLLRVDPQENLFRIIRGWPTFSRSAETLLAARNGHEVVFLNEVRHRKGTALQFRLPLSRKDLASVRAVRGESGVVEAIDYRGVPVLASLEKVPGTPWFLIAKVDREEIYAPLQVKATKTALLAILLALGASLAIVTLWQRQRSRRDVRESQEQAKLLEDILSATPDQAWLFDPQRRCTFANREGLRVLGKRREEVVGKGLASLGLPGLLEARLDAQMGGVFGTGKLVKDETVLSGIEGQRSYDYVLSPVRSPTGSIDFVLLTVRDVAERAQAAAALRESQERLDLAMKASNVGLWTWDLPTKEVYFSPQWKAQLGYEDREIPNRYEEWESRLHPQDREMAVSSVRSLAEKQGANFELEFRLRHRDGSYRWILSRALALRSTDGGRVRLMGCHLDLTERKKMEDEIQRLNRDLEGKVAERTSQLEAVKRELEAFT